VTEERRQERRLALHLPIRVAGRNSDLTVWQAATTTEDVASSGAAFVLAQPIEVGQIVRLSLPLPPELRRFDADAPAYRIYAEVRDAIPSGPATRVGVKFLDKGPPQGLELAIAPQTRRIDATAPGAEAREYPRYEAVLHVRIRRTDPWTHQLQEEMTSTDDVGLGGARVRTSLSIDKGEVVDFEEVETGFWTKAEVRNVSIGSDNVPRLNLHFLRPLKPVEEFLRRLDIEKA